MNDKTIQVKKIKFLNSLTIDKVFLTLCHMHNLKEKKVIEIEEKKLEENPKHLYTKEFALWLKIMELRKMTAIPEDIELTNSDDENIND